MSRVVPKISRDEMRTRREILCENLRYGRISCGDAVREMRLILGLTQAQYAKMAKMRTSQLSLIERDKANPTIKTLQALGKPFGFAVGFVVPDFPR